MMTEEGQHCASWKDAFWSGLVRVAAACVAAIPPALYLHQRYAPTPTLTYDVQELPFEPLIEGQKWMITVLAVANEGNVSLTGVGLSAEFAGHVHHCGTTERGRASIQIETSSSDAGTVVLYGDLGRLPIGGRLSVGVISSRPLAGEPKVASNEIVGTRATTTGPPAAYTLPAVAVCVLVLLGATAYLLLLFIRRTRATTEWARALARYALANRRGLRHP